MGLQIGPIFQDIGPIYKNAAPRRSGAAGQEARAQRRCPAQRASLHLFTFRCGPVATWGWLGQARRNDGVAGALKLRLSRREGALRPELPGGASGLQPAASCRAAAPHFIKCETLRRSLLAPGVAKSAHKADIAANYLSPVVAGASCSSAPPYSRQRKLSRWAWI